MNQDNQMVCSRVTLTQVLEIVVHDNDVGEDDDDNDDVNRKKMVERTRQGFCMRALYY